MRELYRCVKGVVCQRWIDGSWHPSAHDHADEREIPSYEEMGHPATEALKEKYFNPGPDPDPRDTQGDLQFHNDREEGRA